MAHRVTALVRARPYEGGAGLRRSELAALNLGDYTPNAGELTITGGKGNEDRICYVVGEAAKTLGAWLATGGDEPGPVFCPYREVRRGGSASDDRTSGLLAMQKRAVEAGVAHSGPHDLRRSFVSNLLDAGADVSAVQSLAGHSNVATTLRYDRRADEAKRRAAALLDVPFAGPDRGDCGQE